MNKKDDFLIDTVLQDFLNILRKGFPSNKEVLQVFYYRHSYCKKTKSKSANFVAAELLLE